MHPAGTTVGGMFVTQAVASVLVGMLLTAATLLPLLVLHYRRYGAPSPTRLVGWAIALTYAAAVVAYTLFPMPWGMTAQDCVGRGWPVVLDPTAYFRAIPGELAGLGWAEMATSWVVLQMVLNVALFLPLGVLGVRLAHWSAARTIVTGLGASLLVEATQFTGNWFLMPCSYRLADVNDLLTNTTGTALGVGVAALLPQVFADPRALVEQRDVARPVTRVRRWTAIVLDAWIVGLAVVVALGVAMAAFGLVLGTQELGPLESALLGDLLQLVGVVTAVALAVVPSLVGPGGSLGQRIVHLRPRPLPGRGGRWLRPATLRGLALVGVCSLDPLWMLAGTAWLAADAAWVVREPRGLSGVLTGYDVVDSRAEAPARPALVRW